MLRFTKIHYEGGLKMPSETIKHFYEEIKFLAAEVGQLGLPEKFIEAAKAQSEYQITEIFEEFKEDNPELWERFSKLYEDYNEESRPKIFCDYDCKAFYRYNPTEVDPLNLCFVFMFSEGVMCDNYVFKDFRILASALEEEGQEELAEYILWEQALGTLVYDLMRAFEYQE